MDKERKPRPSVRSNQPKVRREQWPVPQLLLPPLQGSRRDHFSEARARYPNIFFLDKGKERHPSKEDTEHPFRASNRSPLSALQAHLPNSWAISQTAPEKVLKTENKSKEREDSKIMKATVELETYSQL